MLINQEAPVGADFIKNWPAQNAVNCDTIDDYAGAQCLRTHPLGLYTPVLSAVTTAPTLGTLGTIGGFYYKIFDWVYTWGFFRFATGFSVGSGVYTISLPFKAKSNLPFTVPPTNGPILGSGNVWDDFNSATRQPVSVQLRTPETIMFGVRMNSGASAREVTHGSPVAWAVDDGLKWSARYQRDTT